MRGVTREGAKLCVGAGWHGLLDELYDHLPEGAWVSQVKEKFGALRFYCYGVDDAFWKRVHAAEAQSQTMCERCGAAATTTTRGGWMVTRCDQHLKT